MAVSYPETVLRAVKIIKSQIATQQNPEFPFRWVRADFTRVGLTFAALTCLVELGMIEEAEPSADVKWYRPTGHAVWREV